MAQTGIGCKKLMQLNDLKQELLQQRTAPIFDRFKVESTIGWNTTMLSLETEAITWLFSWKKEKDLDPNIIAY